MNEPLHINHDNTPPFFAVPLDSVDGVGKIIPGPVLGADNDNIDISLKILLLGRLRRGKDNTQCHKRETEYHDCSCHKR